MSEDRTPPEDLQPVSSHQRLSDLFLRACELDPSERAVFLEEACAGDAELRAEVESLLAHDSMARRAMKTGRGAVQAFADAPFASETPTEARPARIGAFRIVRTIGEGGMGVVYEAEQQQPERTVALKVVRGGQFVDEQRVQMLQREANALARLKHPNIATIHEFGRTEKGQHYFAMELVRGETLDAYLKTRPTAVTSPELHHRLGLFRKLCDAVHYAHQRGVIHRDLNPSNVIVMRGDGNGNESELVSPEIKILDFGLARITDTDVAATSMVTEVGVIKGTLAYMSPEQARGRPEEIDVRADVYALGVILYEMLSGQRPYNTESGSLVEAVRVICEQPPKPLRQTWSGVRKLDPDIETIVATALEKDADRRYGSTSALSEDVGRYLVSQPILARPPSTIYQLRKLISRHKVGISGLVAMFVVLIAASVVSTALYVKAQREAERARTEEGKSAQVATFMTEMLGAVGPSVAQGRDTTLLREILDQTAERVVTDLEGQPEVEATIRTVLGATYNRLGKYEPAEVHLRASLDIRRRVLGKDHPDTLTSMDELGFVLKQRGRFEEAEMHYREAVEGCRRVLGDDHPQTLGSTSNLGLLLLERGESEEGERYLRATLESRRRVLGDDHPDTLLSANALGGMLWDQDRLDEAEPYFREALDGRRRVLGNDHPSTLTSIHNMGSLLDKLGKYNQAEPYFREVLERRRRVLGDEHPKTLVSIGAMGGLLQARGKLEEAERYRREALEGYRGVVGEDHPKMLTALNNMGSLLQARGRLDEAEPYLREALESSRRTLGDDHPRTLVSINSLGYLLLAQGKPDEAEPYYREGFERRRRVFGDDHPKTLNVIGNTGYLLQAQGKLDEAETHLSTALEGYRRSFGDDHPTTLITIYGFAILLQEQGRLDEAESHYHESLEGHRRVLGDNHPQTLRVIRSLVKLYEVSGKPDKATEWREKLPIAGKDE